MFAVGDERFEIARFALNRIVSMLVRDLLLDHGKRIRMGAASAAFAGGERSVESAALLLAGLLAKFAAAPA